MDKVKVLYVEDEPFLAQIVQESLTSRGFDVKLVTQGKAITEACKTFMPDICVLDVMLPYKSGFDIARELREQEIVIPIIFLTAKKRTEDLLEGFKSGGNDYLKKPFSMEELIVRIQNLLALSSVKKHDTSKKHTENQPVTLGKYTFYPGRYELRLGDRIRKLSYRENALLQLLISGREEPVQRKDILLKIWGDDSFYNSRNLDVYITKLRECFKDDPAVEIVTIKGVGYHFLVKSRE